MRSLDRYRKENTALKSSAIFEWLNTWTKRVWPVKRTSPKLESNPANLATTKVVSLVWTNNHDTDLTFVVSSGFYKNCFIKWDIWIEGKN